MCLDTFQTYLQHACDICWATEKQDLSTNVRKLQYHTTRQPGPTWTTPTPLWTSQLFSPDSFIPTVSFSCSSSSPLSLIDSHEAIPRHLQGHIHFIILWLCSGGSNEWWNKQVKRWSCTHQPYWKGCLQDYLYSPSRPLRVHCDRSMLFSSLYCSPPKLCFVQDLESMSPAILFPPFLKPYQTPQTQLSSVVPKVFLLRFQ